MKKSPFGPLKTVRFDTKPHFREAVRVVVAVVAAISVVVAVMVLKVTVVPESSLVGVGGGGVCGHGGRKCRWRCVPSLLITIAMIGFHSIPGHPRGFSHDPSVPRPSGRSCASVLVALLAMAFACGRAGPPFWTKQRKPPPSDVPLVHNYVRK